MIIAFATTVLFMAVVVALCIGALMLLNAALNPPRFRMQTAQQTIVETARAQRIDRAAAISRLRLAVEVNRS